MRESRTVSLADARRVIDAGEKKAEELGQPANLDSIGDPRPRPDEDAERRQDRRTLHQLLGRMSEKRRTVLALCEICGYTPEEIARLEGVPAVTVRSRLFEARRDFLELVTSHRRREQKSHDPGRGRR